MPETEKDQEFLEYVVKTLVDSPEDVEVKRTVDEMGVLLTLKVNAKDMGLVIGRDGSTARAIRTLIRILGLRNHSRVNLKIEEPEGGRMSAVPAPPKEAALETPEEPAAPQESPLDDLKL